jgi:hypothetical protein
VHHRDNVLRRPVPVGEERDVKQVQSRWALAVGGVQIDHAIFYGKRHLAENSFGEVLVGVDNNEQDPLSSGRRRP